MKIIYGISGEGLGHVFEAIEIITFLKHHGHEVKILTYGERSYTLLKKFEPTRIEGIALKVGVDGLSLWSTFFQNLHILPFYIKNWRKLKREIISFNPDVFITAFEPYTTLISHILHKPLISIDNQQELLSLSYPQEGASWFDLKITQWAIQLCTWNASYYIVKSFNKNQKMEENRYFVSPIIQQETRKKQSTIGDHFFVYLTKPNDELIRILKTIPEKFIIYCNNKVGVEGNLIYRASGGQNYLEDLSSCKAIIGTTGFSLIADALYLKKPYFGVPLKKQFEQIYNAHFLRKFNVGEFTENINRKELDAFFEKLPQYRFSLAHYEINPQEQEETLEKILRKIDIS